MIKSILTEYGVPWVFNRLLYSAKLKLMNAMPFTENLFEHKVRVSRLDIFDLEVEPIEKFLIGLSEEKQREITLLADNAIQGKIRVFSSIDLDYGNPINWHMNPLTNKEVNKSLKWYRIPDFDHTRGDIKIIWEASRFTHFYYFVRAYMITKNKKYFKAFSQQLTDWLQANDYSYGPNYKCGQEATLRMINTLIAFSAFKSYGLTSQEDEENVRTLVEGSYKKVLSNFFYAYKCIKNNHTLSEIIGLIIGAWASEDERRLSQAYDLLEEVIQEQFLPDGGYIQYSFNYQRFALQLMQFVIKISSKTNIQISGRSKELLKKSANLIYQMQDEKGDVPNYGSNDGALIFPVTSCGFRDFRPVVNTIIALIDGKRIYEQGDYDEELMWFGYRSLVEVPISKIERKSSSFNESGFYSLRHDHGFLMIILQDFKTRPAQMDQHHIDLWHEGLNIFCDSGTYSYATDIGKEMALTAAHNTVMVQSKEQMNKRGPFLIYDWTRRESVKHSNNSFIGIMNSLNGYRHTRNVLKNDSGYSIIDDVTGDGEFCEFYFHTPCDIKKIKTGFELYHKGQCVCRVLTNGVLEINKSFRSLLYLNKEEINCITVRGTVADKKCSMRFDIELMRA